MYDLRIHRIAKNIVINQNFVVFCTRSISYRIMVKRKSNKKLVESKEGNRQLYSPLCNLFYPSFSLSEFSTTLRLEHAISPLAHIGVIWKSIPKMCKAPAASGMHTML